MTPVALNEAPPKYQITPVKAIFLNTPTKLCEVAAFKFKILF